MREKISVWFELGKVKITSAVSITTVTGYLLYTAEFSPVIIWTVTGIFLLASGASALNHLQELRYDRKMERTQNRPLPSRRISLKGAIGVTLVFSLTGSFLLYMGTQWQGLLLGWLAYFWYNVVYTYLKRSTAWAVIPGSLVGSIPPVIGWVSAGGSISGLPVLSMAGFFFIWQVPHFWLLILKYGREYENAGFPSLSRIMSERLIGRTIFAWIVGTALMTLIFTLYGPLNSNLSRIGLWIASAWLLITFTPILRRSLDSFQPGPYFMRINYFVLVAVVFMCLDKLLFVQIEQWL